MRYKCIDHQSPKLQKLKCFTQPMSHSQWMSENFQVVSAEF